MSADTTKTMAKFCTPRTTRRRREPVAQVNPTHRASLASAYISKNFFCWRCFAAATLIAAAPQTNKHALHHRKENAEVPAKSTISDQGQGRQRSQQRRLQPTQDNSTSASTESVPSTLTVSPGGSADPKTDDGGAASEDDDVFDSSLLTTNLLHSSTVIWIIRPIRIHDADHPSRWCWHLWW